LRRVRLRRREEDARPRDAARHARTTSSRRRDAAATRPRDRRRPESTTSSRPRDVPHTRPRHPRPPHPAAPRPRLPRPPARPPAPALTADMKAPPPPDGGTAFCNDGGAPQPPFGSLPDSCSNEIQQMLQLYADSPPATVPKGDGFVVEVKMVITADPFLPTRF